MRSLNKIFVGMLILLAVAASATIFGSLRGVVHDPQHRPVSSAMVMLKAKSSEWTKTTNTDSNGQFELNAIPIGEYTVSVANPGFIQGQQAVVIDSGSQPVMHFQLAVASKSETVTVSAGPQLVITAGKKKNHNGR